MKNIHILPTDKPSRLHLWTDENGTRPALCELEYSHTRNTQHIYITSDEEIKEGDWILYCNSVYKVLRINSNNRPVVKMSDGEFELSNWNKIILTDNKDLIKDGVQAIDDEFLEWFVKNPSCEEISIEWLGTYTYGIVGYKIIIPKEEPTAYHYLSCCRSVEECHCGKYPKQIKCYCGHTTMCDCIPQDEAFGIIYVLETLLDFAGEDNATSISISTTDAVKIIKLLKQIK